MLSLQLRLVVEMRVGEQKNIFMQLPYILQLCLTLCHTERRDNTEGKPT